MLKMQIVIEFEKSGLKESLKVKFVGYDRVCSGFVSKPQQDHSRLKHPINSTVENLVFLDPLESEGSKNI